MPSRRTIVTQCEMSRQACPQLAKGRLAPIGATFKRAEYHSGCDRKLGMPVAIQLCDEDFLTRYALFPLCGVSPCLR